MTRLSIEKLESRRMELLVLKARSDAPAMPCPRPLFAAIELPEPGDNLISKYQGARKHALPSHHAARPRSRCRAEILSGRPGIEGGPPHRQRQGEIHAGVFVRGRGRAPAEEFTQDTRRAAGRTHLQLGRGKIRRGSPFRSPRL